MKKQLFGKIGAISSKLAAPSRKISMKRPSLAVSGPNPSELWKRYWKKVVDIIFWGCTFSAQLIYWVRKFEVLPTHFPWVLTMQRSVLQVIKKQKRCASKRWSFSMRYEPLTPSFDHVKVRFTGHWKKQKRCASKCWSISMRYEPLIPSFDHVKVQITGH